MENYVKNIVRKAKAVSYQLAKLDTRTKNKILLTMADYLLKDKKDILAANSKDVAHARQNGLKESFIDRLTLTESRLREMSLSLAAVAKLPDPVNKVIAETQRPNGLLLAKVRVPLGVILMVYEARPNVTSDSIGLLFKSSNAAILRGGKDALASNRAIGRVLTKAARAAGLNFTPFFVIDKPDHQIVDLLLKQAEYIDLVIPRGGEPLIRKVVSASRIPVIKHYKGICAIFVDGQADIEKALKICVNAKVPRPAVCNAVETILVHKNIAAEFLPRLKKEFDKFKVEIRGDLKTTKIIKGVKAAKAQDWRTEYLDLIAAVGVVNNIDEAIRHINFYGSHHTDSIITNIKSNADKFVREVDSACCFVNVSTRFSDGYQFGLGTEIGISTDKLHARGPMGLEELTTYKWVGRGSGQVRK